MRPPDVTVIGAYVVPVGTATVREVIDAAVTADVTAPKYTMLLAAIALKFVPVIMTDVPTGPEIGLKELIVGTWARAVERHARMATATADARTRPRLPR